MSRAEAIEKTFGITEKKQQNVTGKETETLENGGGERGTELGHGERPPEGEPGGAATAAGQPGTAGQAQQQAVGSESAQQPKEEAEGGTGTAPQPVGGVPAQGETPASGQTEGTAEGVSDGEVEELVQASKSRAIAKPIPIQPTLTAWQWEFGNGVLNTPMGKVKLGENQYAKIIEKGRENESGMIKPTLTDPDFVIEEKSAAKDGNTERESSYLFIKAFIDNDRKKHYFFMSVTVKKDGLEVNVSNHINSEKRVRRALKEGKLLYRFDGGAQTEQTPASASVTTSPVDLQGVSDSKDTKNFETDKEKVAIGGKTIDKDKGISSIKRSFSKEGAAFGHRVETVDLGSLTDHATVRMTKEEFSESQRLFALRNANVIDAAELGKRQRELEAKIRDRVNRELDEGDVSSIVSLNGESVEIVEQKKQRANGKASKVSASERSLRDAIVGLLRKAGIDVVTESEEGQRVLDMARSLGISVNDMRRNKKSTSKTAVPGEETPFKAAVVSEIDAAKIAKNLDSLIKKTQHLSNEQKKHFISEVAKVLGARKYGSNSEYVTFETKNGEVTLRLADHNAKVSNFDYSGRENGISIVISRKPNTGIENDGNAHIVEYFYPDKALKKADNSPYSEIVRSIQQMLYSGEYKDTTGLAQRQEVNAEQVRMHMVKFFRTESGEAYGFTMGGKIYLDPKIATAETPIHEYTHLWAEALRAANPKAWEQLKSELEKDKDLMAYVQRLYPELKGDELMDEVFAHFSGRRGAERLREEQRKAMDEASDYVEKSGVVAMFERLRDALKKFWNMARDLFAGKMRGIKSMSAEDFADMVLGGLVGGYNPNKTIVFSDNPNVQKNIEKGLNALERLANGEDEVSDAMHREELTELGGTANIAFIWGKSGRMTEQGRNKGGEGFQKIIEKHGIEDAIKIVETIAKGEIGEPYGVEGGQRVDIDFKDHHTTVSLFRNGVSKSWVLTGYTIDSNTDAKGRGSDLSSATQNDPIRTRAELGAVLKSAAKIRQIFDISEKSKKKDEIKYQKADSGVRSRGEEEPVFYSNDMRAVEDIEQERATPEQWVKMIEKRAAIKKALQVGLGSFSFSWLDEGEGPASHWLDGCVAWVVNLGKCTNQVGNDCRNTISFRLPQLWLCPSLRYSYLRQWHNPVVHHRRPASPCRQCGLWCLRFCRHPHGSVPEPPAATACRRRCFLKRWPCRGTGCGGQAWRP